MKLYAQVRRSVFVEGLSEREAAKRFGLARGTVRKMLRYATPPGYRRRQPAQRPKLDPFTGIVDQILIDDQERPKKQRHTAKRIFDRLRDEYDFTGGQEMFVALVHPPGDAQADFGEALVVIDGVQRKAHYLVVDLPHSDDAFVKAFPAETTEAFCGGHNAAFRYFGGVPRSILYDNTTLAVARILGDAGQGESNIRRWIIDNDWLEAIVALPLNMFYNTGIATYIWVLTNRKPEHRRGKVQLIDATGWYQPLRKNLGKKNCELGEEDIDCICDTFLAFEETEQSKIFDDAAFGYLKVTVDRPLRIEGADPDRVYKPADIKALKERGTRA